jgi:hypothetical protein
VSADDPSEDASGHGRNVAALAVAFEGGLGLLALLLGWLLGVWPIPGMERTGVAWGDQLPALAWGVAATGPMLLGFWLIDRFAWGPLAALKADVERLVVPVFRNSSIVDLALVALAAGIGEEMLFRGLLQHGLAHWLAPPWGIWLALAIASAAFGCAHMLSATYAVLAGLIGLYLGLLLIWTGSLLAPAVAHGLYDFIALLYLVRSDGTPASSA